MAGIVLCSYLAKEDRAGCYTFVFKCSGLFLSVSWVCLLSVNWHFLVNTHLGIS